MIDPQRYFQGLGQAHGFNPMDPSGHASMINNFRGLATHPMTPPGIADQLHYHANSLQNLNHVMTTGQMPGNPASPSVFDQGGISPAGQYTTGDPAGGPPGNGGAIGPQLVNDPGPQGGLTPMGSFGGPGVQAMPPQGNPISGQRHPQIQPPPQTNLGPGMRNQYGVGGGPANPGFKQPGINGGFGGWHAPGTGEPFGDGETPGTKIDNRAAYGLGPFSGQ